MRRGETPDGLPHHVNSVQCDHCKRWTGLSESCQLLQPRSLTAINNGKAFYCKNCRLTAGDWRKSKFGKKKPKKGGNPKTDAKRGPRGPSAAGKKKR